MKSKSPSYKIYFEPLIHRWIVERICNTGSYGLVYMVEEVASCLTEQAAIETVEELIESERKKKEREDNEAKIRVETSRYFYA